ncbi:hypothetical protein SAMN05892883_0205 [Jatrophihabitans sp. GAS493]|uniref:hypothetical protein n=1 Tax=Jatrophihabitans sp. GAS493 TaxID=1907575 RepID=UPI000BB87BF0|nr:hypothetical protein [Jatrophihabitans sp. GAS493]SOD70513.1 hypothetical protein SAMN05892883_0205 [Jatrophihabitans sp. GAS493]
MRRQLVSTLAAGLAVCSLVTSCSGGGPETVTLDQHGLSATDVTDPDAADAGTAADNSPGTEASDSASPYEDDASVVAWRSWALAAAQTVNAGKVTTPALDELMTAAFAKQMPAVLGPELSKTYPGPMPFTPISVTELSPTARSLRICLVTAGFARDRATGKVKQPLAIRPMSASATYQNGAWLTSGLTPDAFSCSGVQVPMPAF